MRLAKHGDQVVVALSRRNLSSLLAKLDGHPPGSACTLIGGAGAIGLTVRAEEDDEHYANAGRGDAVGIAGEIHHDTADAIAAKEGRHGC